MEANLIIIAGPTAVGKTDLCVKLAKHMDAEIISADSRQLYREMHIGTAKPTSEEMQGIVHHFVDSHSVAQLYSAGDYERDVDTLLVSYFKRKKVAILTGGTGLFIRAVLHGLDDMPQAPEKLRAELMERLQKEGLPSLQKTLMELDPVAARGMDISNPQRVVRALEVCIHTGKPFSGFHQKATKSHGYRLIKIGLERPREELYERINRRVLKMLEDGLVEEVRALMPFQHLNALQTVGYKEVFAHLRGEIAYPEMVELLQRNSRKYAKRQLTWFKNQEDLHWFHPDDFTGILEFIKHKMV